MSKTTAAPVDPEVEPEAPLSLLSIELGGWGPIKAPVRLDLDPRVTVLVGKNGAGKSVLMEGIAAAADAAIGMADLAEDAVPQTFSATTRERDSILRYHANVRFNRSRDGLLKRRSVSQSWHDRLENDAGEQLWASDAGKLLDSANQVVGHTDRDEGWLGQVDHLEKAPFGEALSDLFYGVELVRSGFPRQEATRQPLLMRFDGEMGSLVSDEGDPGLSPIASTIISWCQDDYDRLQSLEHVCRRIGIVHEFSAPAFGPPDEDGHPLAIYHQLYCGDTDLGLLPDGTLRVLQILVALVGSSEGDVVLIEEPELGIHPSLLHRLLAEIESYSFDRQIVLTTHSPYVVNWARPDGIRLVENINGVISARSLTADEVKRVAIYLREDGSLSDFVYGGALDDE